MVGKAGVLVAVMAALVAACGGTPAPSPAPTAGASSPALSPATSPVTAAPSATTTGLAAIEPTPSAPLSLPAVTPAATPEPTPQAYKVQKGDTCSKIAMSAGITINELQEANPGLDCQQLRIGQPLNMPAGVPAPTPTPNPTPTPTPRTDWLPLPAGAATATIHFTNEEGAVAYSKGTTLKLSFRFDGGSITGTGSRAADDTPGGKYKNGRECSVHNTYAYHLSGSFDPSTHLLTGTTSLAVTSKADMSICASQNGVYRETLNWTATLSADATTVKGMVVGSGPADQWTFTGKVTRVP